MSFVTVSNRFLLARISNDFVRYASTSYKAAVLEKFDKPLKVTELKPKKLEDGQARIRVHCCSVNSFDFLLTQGVNPTNYPIPITPGYELAGVVTEVNDCKDVGKGDRVVALSKDLLGGFAEECIVHEKDIWQLPSTIPFDEGTALVDSFGTAMLGLSQRAKLSEKEVVLATFAPTHGFAALDIAAHVFKAKVIAVCMNENDTEKLRERGAWSTLAYTNEKNEKQLISIVNELTNKKGVHVVYDTMAGDVLKSCMKCIRHEGTIIVAGYTLQELPHVNISYMLSLPSFNISGVSLYSYRMHKPKIYRQIISDVLEMKDQGLISPTISARFPLADINQAFELIKTTQPIGKVVIELKS